ncbi:MAG: monovalent cation/H(+) antiporter subunit G [Pseudomonadota bacterium]
MEALLEFWHYIYWPLGAALTLFGAILCVIGTIGALRFPDFYTRLHATSVTDTGGAALMLLGMLILSPDIFVALKVFAIWFLLVMTTPTASHAVANAAHVAGLQPKIGDLSGDQDEDEQDMETHNG